MELDNLFEPLNQARYIAIISAQSGKPGNRKII